MKKNVNGIDVEMTTAEVAARNTEQAQVEQHELKYGYLRKRERDMPSVQEQLMCFWRAMDKGLMPQCTEFYDAIKSVHDKYPKPAE